MSDIIESKELTEDMTRISRILIASLVLIVIALLPACRSSRKRTVEQPPTPPVTQTVPDVPVAAPVTPVEQPSDFVQETQPKEEVLPSDAEQLNRFLQERGLIRDAFYSYDESTLDTEAQAALTASANWLKANAGYNLLIEGHCDERGTEQYNLALGDRRAHTAREFLATLGIDDSRMRIVSYGEERPFDEGHDESAWRANRRAHLVVVK